MSFDFGLYSGAFRLSTATQSVDDWLVLNDTDSEQHVRVTVFVASGGIRKYELPPGSRGCLPESDRSIPVRTTRAPPAPGLRSRRLRVVSSQVFRNTVATRLDEAGLSA